MPRVSVNTQGNTGLFIDPGAPCPGATLPTTIPTSVEQRAMLRKLLRLRLRKMRKSLKRLKGVSQQSSPKQHEALDLHSLGGTVTPPSVQFLAHRPGNSSIGVGDRTSRAFQDDRICCEVGYMYIKSALNLHKISAKPVVYRVGL